MAIASSGAVSIGNAAGSDRSINEELDITHNTANSSMTTVVTAAVTGSTPRGSGSVTDARPHAFSEWHSYTHTQDFSTPTYYVRTGTGTANYCVDNSASATDYEASAVANTTFYSTLNIADSNNYMLEWYMDPDHLWRGFPTNFGTLDAGSRTVSARDTSGNVASFTGNFTSGFTPMKIADLNVGPQGEAMSLEVRMTASVIQGTGTYASSVSGYVIDSGWVEFVNSSGNRTSAGAAKTGLSPAAWTLIAGCYSTSIRTPYHRLTMEVKATGYNTKTLNNFVTYHSATATSNNCL